MASELAKLMARLARKQAQPLAAATAVVTAIRPDGIRLQFQGAAAAAGRSFKALAPEALRHGDLVVCLPVGGTWVVLGPAVAQRRLAWYDEMLWDSPSDIYTSSGAAKVDVLDRMGVIRAQPPASINGEAYLILNHGVWTHLNPAVAYGIRGPSVLTACCAQAGLDVFPYPGFQVAAHAKFWYDSADGTGYWMASLGDGSGSFSEASTGIKASATVWHHFRIELDAQAQTPVAKYYIDGEQVAELTAHFPPYATAIYSMVYMKTTLAETKYLDCDYHSILCDRAW